MSRDVRDYRRALAALARHFVDIRLVDLMAWQDMGRREQRAEVKRVINAYSRSWDFKPFTTQEIFGDRN